MVELQAELSDARAEARADMAVAPPTDGVIHDIIDDNKDDDIPYGGEQWALLASFDSLPKDTNRRQALAAEAEARSHALAMSRAYLCSDLDLVERRGPEHARVDRENRELEDAHAARDEAVVVAASDRARYHADMTTAKRVH
jgi:hypothetical protein